MAESVGTYLPGVRNDVEPAFKATGQASNHDDGGPH